MSTSSDDRPQVVALPPLIYAGFLILGFVLEWLWPTRTVAPLVRFTCGPGLIALGLLIGVRALREFSRAQTPVEVYLPTTALVTTGPYRYSRNPIYVAMTVGSAGVAITGDSLWALALVVPAVLVIHYGVVLREEAYLARKFGDAYRAYAASVRRWI